MQNSIIIFGADGYIGWPLAVHLGTKYPEKRIVLVDNLATRKLVKSVHTRSLVPIKSMPHRLAAYERVTGRHNLEFVFADGRDPEAVESVFRKHRPESVVHLAQQRSAPFSMIDQEHALYSELNNVATNMNIVYSMARNSPDAHLLKMGSMGEYGQPGIEIAEGEIEIEHKGRKANVMFPLVAGSYYHLSKIFDTFNVKLANKLFDITATDIMQGVVYGTRTEELVDDELATRFDFDSIWGTLINKYAIQAVALNKLLIYGKGKQKRGFLSLYDSINCLTLLLENPPKKGQYRIVNQLDEVYDTLELAAKVQSIAREYGIEAGLEYVPNPRVEKDEHYYEVETKILPSLGFRRTKNIDVVLHEIFETVLANKDRIGDAKELIYPTVQWKSGKLSRSPLFKLPKEILSVVTPEDMDYNPNGDDESSLAQEPFEVVKKPSQK